MQDTSDLDRVIDGPTRSPIAPMAALFALFLLVLVGGGAIAAWKADELALERQSRILDAVLAADLHTEALMARDYAWWDATQEHAVDSWNQDWVDNNIGTYLFEGFGYSVVMVLAPDHRVIGVEIASDVPDLHDAARLGEAIGAMRPLLDKAATAPWSDPLGGAGLVRIDQSLFMVSAAPVTPETIPGPRAPRPARALLVLMKRLDTQAVVALGRRLLLQDLSLHASETTLPQGLARLPVAGVSNDQAGWFAWVPDRPGTEMIETMLPWALAATLGMLGLGAIVLTRSTAQARALTQSVAALQARARELEESRHAQAEALDRALESDRAKTSFLHAVTHELRSPLNAIIGFSEVLLKYGDAAMIQARRAEYLDDIRSAGLHLLSLINDLLDLARIEDRGASLELAPHDPRKLLDEPLRLMAPLLDKKHHQVETRFDDDLPTVMADPRAVSQILMNLLSNATKFTAPGDGITLSACSEPGFLRIEIADHGCGILLEKIPRLGRPFEQAGSHWTGSASGLGLGLAISRRLAEEMGGGLRIESELGAWTRVSFTLPRAPADTSAASLPKDKASTAA